MFKSTEFRMRIRVDSADPGVGRQCYRPAQRKTGSGSWGGFHASVPGTKARLNSSLLSVGTRMPTSQYLVLYRNRKKIRIARAFRHNSSLCQRRFVCLGNDLLQRQFGHISSQPTNTAMLENYNSTREVHPKRACGFHNFPACVLR